MARRKWIERLKSDSKNFQVRLIIGIPLVLFGLSILTSLITYHLTMYYISYSIDLPYKLEISRSCLLQFKFWALIIAIFSSMCGLALVYIITNPIKKLLVKTELLTTSHKKSINLHFPDKNDEIGHFYGTFDEVLTLFKSHLREKELKEAMPILDRVRRSDQLASLGFLSASLAHEIRNPLGSMQGLIELMDKDFQKDDQKKTYVKIILKSIERLNQLIEELLEFARPGSEVLEFHNVNNLLAKAVSTARNEFSAKQIQVMEEYQENLSLIQIDPQKMRRAFLNIIRNAFHFTLEGGQIRITTMSQPEGFTTIRFFNSGSYIFSEDLDRIFVPFFTTRKEGTGLGLCIAHHTITAHGGNIQVESSRDSGTTFIVKLPTK